jgi:aspartate carbamoyltransferase
MKHLLSASQFSRHQLEKVFDVADRARTQKFYNDGQSVFWGECPMHRKLVLGFFDEPSTRTSPSFQAATARMGGTYVCHYANDSSMKKGESFSDSVKTLGCYGDVVVARSSKEGEVHDAAMLCHVPVINAGDGKNEHPTQAVLDVYTAIRHFDRLDGLTFLLTGDLAYSRTVRSLLKLLSLYEVHVILTFPHPDVIYGDVSKCIPKERLHFISERELPLFLGKADVLYVTRYQKERPGDRPKSRFVLTPEMVTDSMKDTAIVMSPLPKTNEIDPRVDTMPQAAYWRQVENGMWTRMAILSMISGGYANWSDL